MMPIRLALLLVALLQAGMFANTAMSETAKAYPCEGSPESRLQCQITYMRQLDALTRIIHEGPTVTAHLRTLAREIGVPLLDVL